MTYAGPLEVQLGSLCFCRRQGKQSDEELIIDSSGEDGCQCPEGQTYEVSGDGGAGAFGKIYRASLRGAAAGDVAIKCVLVPPQRRCRELEIHRLLAAAPHPALIKCLAVFTDSPELRSEMNQGVGGSLNLFENAVLTALAAKRAPCARTTPAGGGKGGNNDGYGSDERVQTSQLVEQALSRRLFFVFPFIETTLRKFFLHSRADKESSISFTSARQLLRQLATGLHHLHSLSICHRDLTAQNILIDMRARKLFICDFGSAKVVTVAPRLTKPNEGLGGERSTAAPPTVAAAGCSAKLCGTTGVHSSYVCGRFYRAPELLLGSQNYGLSVDVWSFGCLAAEFFRGGIVLFRGRSGTDQLVAIIRVLGSPTRMDIAAMNPDSPCAHIDLPLIAPLPLAKFLPAGAGPDAAQLVAQTLKFNPAHRLSSADILRHEFFSPLTVPNCTVADGVIAGQSSRTEAGCCTVRD